MKQILHHPKDGTIEVADVPQPQVRDKHLLIRTRTSLISAGTERMSLQFGRANMLDKARQRPEKVRMVLDKVKTDGLAPTIEAVRHKLDQPLAMGYCNCGEVLEVGRGMEGSGFAPGDRVVSNGSHADVVCSPRNLCAAVPDGVSDDAAAFTVIGSIALQGVRLTQPTLGESYAVIGMGLLGLITVQILRAQGCRVLGIDLDAARLELAAGFGAETVNLKQGEDPIAAAEKFTRGRGIDAVLITAATKSNEPVHQAAVMSRKRGRIVLVGVTGLQLSRADFYDKELSFQVSCSYGPGRYDPAYEEGGSDYPIGYVRWTEQRNFEAVLDLMASGVLDVESLITHKFSIDEAARAYDLVDGGEPSLGILLDYTQRGEARPIEEVRTVPLEGSTARRSGGTPVIGCIGAGGYAGKILIPAFKEAGAELATLASLGGVSSVHMGRKHGFRSATTDTDALIADTEIDTLVIATRHDSHAELVCRALAAGKNVFVEKPLCLTLEELARIEEAYAAARGGDGTGPLLMVGFNRRFAPQVQKMKALLAPVKEAVSCIMTVNTGRIPPDHWTQDPAVGGGRIIGEGCHFVDLLRFIVGAPIVAASATSFGLASGDPVRSDKATATLEFEDGSFGTIHYLANGHKSFPKERLEVFAANRILALDNFRRLRGYGWPGFRKMNLWRQDKGQTACAAAFVRAVAGGESSPIPVDELVEVSRRTIEIAALADR